VPTSPETIVDLPLFQGLGAEERTALAAVMDEARFPSAQQIFAEADPGGISYVIQRGWVELSVRDEDGEKVVIDLIGPGELFGEISLFDGGVRTATALAVTPVEAVALRREALLEYLHARPTVALGLLSNLAKRLRQADARFKARIPDPERVIEEKETLGARLADHVAAFGGSWSFVLTFVGIMAVWTSYNLLSGEAFDPFPFILLNLALSTIAALQGPFIMMSQNRQDSKDRIRAEADHFVNVKAEAEIIDLHTKLDQLRVELSLKLDTLGRRLPKA
jgi:CRP/FNR family cyclic AMP-dependent transcriptional regulator